MAAQQQQNVDVVVVGAGIGGSGLATVLARNGLSVTVLEQQRAFADRVRGEFMAPWGVAIAQRLGLLEAMRQAGGAMPRWAIQYDEFMPPNVAEEHRVDLGALVPDVAGPLCLPHPIACERLARLAASSGAAVVRGVENVQLQLGQTPAVSYRVDGQDVTLGCRLVIGADGRNSTTRQQAGIELHASELTNMIAGLLVDGAADWQQDTFGLGVERDIMFIFFPEGGDRLRLYLAIPPDQRDRFSGSDAAARFLETYCLTSVPAGAHLSQTKPIGPCATLSGEDTWTDTPFAEGVVLIGDAAGYNGPIIGQGLSLAMRDVELVSQLMLQHSDWSPAVFEPYATDRAERMRRVRFMADLHAALFCNFSPHAIQRRGGFLGRMASGADPTLEWLVAAPLVGPYNLPEQAFEASFRQHVLGGAAVAT